MTGTLLSVWLAVNMHLSLASFFVATQLITFWCDASLSDIKEDGVLSVSLENHRNNTLEHFRDHVNALKKVEKQKSGIGLQNVQDLYYYGPIMVGTPGQRLRVLFDTGSADLWLPSSQLCIDNQTYCHKHNTYNHSKSNTYKDEGQNFTIPYFNNGPVSGYTSGDHIKIGRLKAIHQSFLEATHIHEEYVGVKFDGIFGMALPALSVTGATPPFVNMIQQGAVKEPVFAFSMKKRSFSLNGQKGAELVFGGVSRYHFKGNFTFAPVTEKVFWQFQIDGVYLDQNMVHGSYPAFPNSRSSLMYGPAGAIDDINAAIGGRYDQGVLVVNCSSIDSLPKVTYVINKTKFVLTGKDYILKVKHGVDSTTCISSFVGADYLQQFILGEVFMQKYYTQFDMGKSRVGFATAQ